MIVDPAEIADLIQTFGQSVGFTVGGSAYAVKVTPPEYLNRGSLLPCDVEFTIAASGLAFTPVLDMTVNVRGVDYKPITVSRVCDGDDLVAWTIRARTAAKRPLPG